jgi:mannose-6-phosphate isomerase-like protein (cupin superfamily)
LLAYGKSEKVKREILKNKRTGEQLMGTPSANPWATAHLGEHCDYLAPDGSEIRLLPEVGGGGLCHCTLPPARVSKAVRHKTVNEIWYFISGKGQVWRKQGESEAVDEVRQGTSLTIPCTTLFQVRNIGDESLCFLIATIPRWPGEDEAVEVEGHWKS